MDAIAIAAIGMQNDLQRLSSISQNLANVSTSGYKREIPVSRVFSDYMNSHGPAGAAMYDAALSGPMTVAVDNGAGTLRYTGNPLDMAIDGQGYFEVRTETGLAYTRQGGMRVDPRGVLTTQQGFPVMGIAGELSLSGEPTSIDAKGQVYQGERVVGQIKLVRFANPEALVAMGNGLFQQGGARMDTNGGDTPLRSGYAENSNVNSAHEMVRLTETLRHFESMQKIIQGYDELTEKTIRKLGEF